MDRLALHISQLHATVPHFSEMTREIREFSGGSLFCAAFFLSGCDWNALAPVARSSSGGLDDADPMLVSREEERTEWSLNSERVAASRIARRRCTARSRDR
jgi:hypothetical protein